MKEAMGLMLSPEVGTSVIDTGKAIDKKLEEIKKNLPVGIEVEKVYYQPDLVTNAIGQFVNNLIASVVVVVGVLLFTMGMRSGLIIPFPLKKAKVLINPLSLIRTGSFLQMVLNCSLLLFILSCTFGSPRSFDSSIYSMRSLIA